MTRTTWLLPSIIVALSAYCILWLWDGQKPEQDSTLRKWKTCSHHDFLDKEGDIFTLHLCLCVVCSVNALWDWIMLTSYGVDMDWTHVSFNMDKREIKLKKTSDPYRAFWSIHGFSFLLEEWKFSTMTHTTSLFFWKHLFVFLIVLLLQITFHWKGALKCTDFNENEQDLFV